MYKIFKPLFLLSTSVLLLAAVGCKKGTFDINNTNPNVPSSVDPKYSLSAALSSTAVQAAGNPGGASTTGNDLLELYMGYWAVSGDYIPNASLVQYKLTSDFGSSFWDNTYPILQNLSSIESYYSGSAKGAYYIGMSRITKAFLFARLVDIYNNIPYSQALKGGANTLPTYDDAKAVSTSLVNQLDSAVALIKSGSAATSDNPGSYDIMFGGNMAKWIAFANTVKLKILMRQTQMSGGSAFIQSKLSGMTTADFIGAGADATINPGYDNTASNHQNPLWQDIGWTPSGSLSGSNSYFRATTYAVNFYKNNNDPRLSLFYAPNSSGVVRGRPFGSTALEHNSDISAIGGNTNGGTQSFGTLKSPSQGAVVLSSSESLFLQAEAVQRGYLTGSASSLYQSAVSESFRFLGVSGYSAAAATYTSQAGLGDNVNIATSSNPIKTIVLQKWAAMNTIDPLESWSDWRRLGIPSDLPVSIYPGSTAIHIPYRLLYPSSEYSYNTDNVNAQGTIDAMSSKIFWMP
jgi:hypothetical protein